jgi:hypothetical protein
MLIFDEASHTYWLDGVAVPSVTTIIRPLAPDFSVIPPDVLEAKRLLGTSVHTACELDDLGELDDESTDPRVMGYVGAWRAFRRDRGVTIVANECRLAHAGLRFAGTLDRVVAEPSGEFWLLDLKTSADPVPSYGVQLAGYALLLEVADFAVPRSMKRATVHLRGDGTYKLQAFNDPNDDAAFRACLALYQWKEQHA